MIQLEKGKQMSRKVAEQKTLKGTRWKPTEWAWLAEIAKSAGLSRSEFVRRSALMAARAAAAGVGPYFVERAIAPPQNTRINLFPGEAGQKSNTGGVRDAADCSRSDGEAKGGATNDLPSDRPRRAITGKA